MHPSLRLVNERFADVQEPVARLFERDENFRDLCEEYETCVATLSRIEGTSDASGMRNEYAALRLRLEGELLRYLQEHPNGKYPNSSKS